jgi:hypothetical protein
MVPVSVSITSIQRLRSLVDAGAPGLQVGNVSVPVLYSIDPEVSTSSITFGSGGLTSTCALLVPVSKNAKPRPTAVGRMRRCWVRGVMAYLRIGPISRCARSDC